MPRASLKGRIRGAKTRGGRGGPWEGCFLGGGGTVWCRQALPSGTGETVGRASELGRVLCQAPPSPLPRRGSELELLTDAAPSSLTGGPETHILRVTLGPTPRTPCHLCFEGSRSSAWRVPYPHPWEGESLTREARR